MPNDPDTNFQPDQRAINTQGGDHIHTGNIIGTGIAIGAGSRVDVTITEEQAYTVVGLPNPYLGLRTFTAAERDIFAGRERIVRALVERLSADNGDRLLFIVGASGSGKSSLARAGLLPALADRLAASGYNVQTRIIDHPGRRPASTLSRLLWDDRTVPDIPSSQLLLLFIDQFEEIFSQADSDEREQALSLLIDQVTSFTLPVRIIATMRSDFLPHLVADARFEPYEQRKVIVRAMNESEIQEAIQRPIQVRYPDKRLEPALVKRLSQDAAADAAYLPLLQVTLEDLWRGGHLRLGAYHGLANAIQRRADEIYAYRDYDGLQQERRTPEEQAAILSLFLNLVRVSLDDEQRDVRWRRSRSELTQGDPQRERLIADLASARLLRTDREVRHEDGQEWTVETVDIVHEALIAGWPTLKTAIASQRDELQQRVRFRLALTEWKEHREDAQYLLSGVRLAEAQALAQRQDVELNDEDAKAFLERSLMVREAERRRKLESTLSVALTTEAIRLSQRRREQNDLPALLVHQAFVFNQRSQNYALAEIDRALRSVLSLPHFGPVVAAPIHALCYEPVTNLLVNLLAGYAAHYTQSLALAPESRVSSIPATWWGYSGMGPDPTYVRPEKLVATSTDGSIITELITGTADGHANPGVEGQVRRYVASHPETTLAELRLVGWDSASFWRNAAYSPAVALSMDGSRVAHHLHYVSSAGTVHVWDLRSTDSTDSADSADSTYISPLRLRDAEMRTVSHLTFSLDSRWLAASDDQSIRIWDLAHPNRQPMKLSGLSSIGRIAFNHDASALFSSEMGGTRVWYLRDVTATVALLGSHVGAAQQVCFSSNGYVALSSGADDTIQIWRLNDADATAHRIACQRYGYRLASRAIEMGEVNYTNYMRNIFPIGWVEQAAPVALSHDTRWLAAALIDESDQPALLLWDLAQRDATPTCLPAVVPVPLRDPTEPPRVRAMELAVLAFSSDGQSLLGLDIDRVLGFWALRRWNRMDLEAAPQTVSEGSDLGALLTLSADGSTLASICVERTSTSGVFVTPVESPITGNSVPPWPSAKIWNLRAAAPEPQVLYRKTTDALGAIALDPAGCRCAVGSFEGLIIVWDLTQQPPRETILSGHSDRVRALAFHPNGEVLASSSDDGTLLLWDVAHPHANPVSLPSQGEIVSTLAFSHDGRLLLTGSPSGAVRLWIVDTALLANMIRSKVLRNMTIEEWERYIGTDLPYEPTREDLPQPQSVPPR